MEEGTNIAVESLIRHNGPVQSSCFGCHIGGLVARQASMAKYQAKHNRHLTIECQVGHLNQNPVMMDGWVNNHRDSARQVCADKMILPRLTTDEQKSLVHSIEFGSETLLKLWR
jgi:hypothetical protein